ncbi:MAG: ATP-binding protein [Butyrivibrio sp.]|nr:ATP-binding protein [Butyrivibrio sp.]
MEKNDKLVSNTFRGILLVNVLSTVSSISAVMIDAIITGQFLGSGAVAAMGLIQPMVMLFNLLGAFFGPGVGIVCTRYMGKARLDRVVQVFTLVMIVMFSVAVAGAIVLFVFSKPLAVLIGSRTNDPDIINMIIDYFRGYSFGIPFVLLSICLNGLMMLDNDRKLGIKAVFTTLITDTIFDLLNVTVIHGGMGGMAVATSLSSVLGFLVLLTHFRKKERILFFRPSGLKFGDLKEVVLSSVPNGISVGSNAVRNFCFNVLILAIATKAEVTALSATNSAFSIIMALTIAFNVTTSTLCSLLFGEEDRKGIEAAFKISTKTAFMAFAVVMVVFMVAANGLAHVFIKSGDPSVISTTAFFIRCMSVQLFLASVAFPIAGVYQGTRHLKANYLLVIMRDMVFHVLSVSVLGKIFGIVGVGIGFITAGALGLLSCFVIPMCIKKKVPTKIDDLIMLKDDFGSKPENTFEASVSDTEGVMDVSTRVMDFYKAHKMDKRTSMFISLFVEEMLTNTIDHGYKDDREKNIDIRVIYGEDKQTIRIRDNGKPFDPVEWHKKNHPEDPASGLGIRMVMGFAKEVRYVPAMDMNNIMLIL